MQNGEEASVFCSEFRWHLDTVEDDGKTRTLISLHKKEPVHLLRPVGCLVVCSSEFG